MASESTSETPKEEPTSSNNKDDSARFECNICLDAAKDAVVSLCGHLFCWPCLSQWLDTRPNNQVCPVCKSAIDQSKVVPIYGRGGDSADPRRKVPPRPKGQRSEAPNHGFGGFNFGAFNNDGMMGDGVGGLSNVHFSFGIGNNVTLMLMFMVLFIQGIFPLSFAASFFGGGHAERGGGGDNTNQGRAEGDGANRAGAESAAPGSRMAQEEDYLANVFKYIAFAMLVWLIFV